MNKEQLETIQIILKTLNDSPFPKSNLSTVLEILSDKFFVRRSFLFAYQKETERLNPLAVNGLNSKVETQQTNVDLYGWVEDIDQRLKQLEDFANTARR